MGIFSLGTIITVETLIGVELGSQDRFCSTNFNVYAEFERGEREGVYVYAHRLETFGCWIVGRINSRDFNESPFLI